MFLSDKSITELSPCHPLIRGCVVEAIKNTKVDFTVMDGLRTIEEQATLVSNGKSKTLNSMHLKQKDGYSHAVDLVPYIKGQPVWDMKSCYLIADAMRNAANKIGAELVWGAVWDRSLNSLIDISGEVDEYVKRRKEMGKNAFLDGPHFQLSDKYRR